MDYEKLSKEISYALRHSPWEYELELDIEGWVDINQLIKSLHKDDCWNKLNENDLYMMIEKSDKKRHEISAGKIRAVYGHSTQQRISKEAAIPPKILYHGTASRFMVKIMKKGLLPQERQYVHLSSDVETAILVGQRREDKPVLLKINALEAWNEGIKFYFENEKIWLADYIPNKYISI